MTHSYRLALSFSMVLVLSGSVFGSASSSAGDAPKTPPARFAQKGKVAPASEETKRLLKSNLKTQRGKEFKIKLRDHSAILGANEFNQFLTSDPEFTAASTEEGKVTLLTTIFILDEAQARNIIGDLHLVKTPAPEPKKDNEDVDASLDDIFKKSSDAADDSSNVTSGAGDKKTTADRTPSSDLNADNKSKKTTPDKIGGKKTAKAEKKSQITDTKNNKETVNKSSSKLWAVLGLVGAAAAIYAYNTYSSQNSAAQVA